MSSGKQGRGNGLLLGISIFFSLLVLEIGLRFLTPFPVHGELANTVAHPLLGYTLDPSDKEVDADGFRNPTAEGTFTIVAIGDSHTQGFNVVSAESYPQQLASMLGVAVYNAGVGGYNVYQYPHLAALAAEKSASMVLLGLLPSNDLIPEIFNERSLTAIPGLNLDAVPIETVKDRPEQSRPSVGDVLQSKLAIVSAVSYLNNKRTSNNDSYHDVGGQAIKKNRVAQHLKYTDLSDPAIRASFENSLSIISFINSELGNQGIKFGVVILPSKELVLQEWARTSKIPLPDGYRIDKEEELIGAYLEYFSNTGISYIDATPFVLAAFQADTESGRIFYPRGDGHPLVNGYQSYAMAAEALIRKLSPQ
jgi:hypothetical protein